MLELTARRPQWRPVVDTVFPFEHAARAQAEMERRRHFGKLVLSVP
jgi:NADPH:quinone reductase-like Zn-dependent oxidoreductase